MTYTVNEGPAPFKDGERSTTVIENTDSVDLIINNSLTNRLVNVPRYVIIPRKNTVRPPNTVNTTVINQVVSGSSGSSFKAQYTHAGTQANIVMRTKLSNNGNGVGSYDDNPSPVWNVVKNELVSVAAGELIEIQIRFQSQTDTLGGAFEIELDKGGDSPIIDIQEYDQTNQFQDYTITFKVVSDSDFVANNACIFIKPELGMTLSISNLSFLILK